MITISIDEEVKSYTEMSDLLTKISGMVAEGYTSGYYPHWSLEGQEEGEEKDND